jgi:glutamate synthase domain-containing protein 1
MCGIVAAVARRNVVPILLEGLKRLEYRGYDSAGVAVVNGTLRRLRSTGRVAELARLAGEHGLSGHLGIAHTRWATHGVPSEKNAHPHISRGVSVVHNGIIENHDAMRSKLQAKGYEFVTETDTEVIAHLVHSHFAADGSLFDAVGAASPHWSALRTPRSTRAPMSTSPATWRSQSRSSKWPWPSARTRLSAPPRAACEFLETAEPCAAERRDQPSFLPLQQ